MKDRTAKMNPKISRRLTLQWLGTAITAASLSGTGHAAPGPSRNGKKAKTYGFDPDLNNPESPWDRVMTAEQLKLTARLSDMILPAEGEHPAPSALGLEEFIDEWVSAPYEAQQKDSRLILAGLKRIDRAAGEHGATKFLKVDNKAQNAILMNFATGEKNPEDKQFFERLRYLIIGAYYTTEEGFTDIGYIGNVALETFPGPSQEIKDILEKELQKLGL